MYVVIRKFHQMRSVREAARRAETGIGELLRQSPGFDSYYVFDAGNGVGGSVSLFQDRDSASVANEKAIAWVRASLADLVQGEPDITQGEVVAMVTRDT
jgi:hypothetical protein